MASELAQRLLDKYIGKYVVGLDENRLNIALWRGEVRPQLARIASRARS